MITLIGFLLMIFALTLVVIYCPDLETPLSPLFYYTYQVKISSNFEMCNFWYRFAACIWIYSTFDNCDGKQARRTGTSSPLGELFDHGCDALDCWVLGLVQLASLTLGTGVISSIFMLITFWGFYLPTWETYHTGVLYLGYVNAPTEGVIFGCFLILLSAIYGPQIYHSPVAESFPSISWPSWMAPHSFQVVAATGAIGSAICILIPSSLITVYQDCRKKGKSFRKALSELTFMVFLSLAAYFWLWSPYTHARKDHFILFHMAVGLAFGKMATKIILAHLTKQPFPYFSGLMIPLFVGSALFNLTPRIFTSLDLSILHQAETIYLWGFLIFAVIGYANWIYHVINSFCTFLDINCLTIKKKTKKEKNDGALPKTPVKQSQEKDRRLSPVRHATRITASPYRRYA